MVIHMNGCHRHLSVHCSTAPDTPEKSQNSGVQMSSGPLQAAKGPLALVRRKIARLPSSCAV